MLILASSAEGGLSTGLQYTCRRGNSATLHLQERLGMHKGGRKYVKTRRGESFHSKWLSCYLGEGLVEIPYKRKDLSLALN